MQSARSFPPEATNLEEVAAARAADATAAVPTESDVPEADRWRSLKDAARAVLERTGMGQERELIEVRGHAMPTPVWAQDEHLMLYTAVFRRQEQLEEALAVNLVLLRPHRHHVSWCVVGFYETDEERGAVTQSLLRWRQRAPWAFEGLLHFAVARTRAWDAPVCKNTAALFGRSVCQATPPSKLICCCLDGDNLVSLSFVRDLVERWKVLGPHACAVRAKGLDSGVTGRIALKWDKFEEIGGYCEALTGAGAQDIDLLNRAGLVTESQLGWKVVGVIKNAGASLPNSPIAAEALNAAKVRHVDPVFARQFRSWGAMSAYNSRRAHALIRAGQVRANPGKQLAHLGLPFEPLT